MARLLVRIILREMHRAGRNTTTLAIVGANAQAVRLLENHGVRRGSDSVPDEVQAYLNGMVAGHSPLFMLGNGMSNAVVDPKLFCSGEVDVLLGKLVKAMSKLSWKPKTTLETLITIIVAADTKRVV